MKMKMILMMTKMSLENMEINKMGTNLKSIIHTKDITECSQLCCDLKILNPKYDFSPYLGVFVVMDAPLNVTEDDICWPE